MLLMYKKDQYDDDCPARFHATEMGHVACCSEMERAFNYDSVIPDFLNEKIVGKGKNLFSNLWVEDGKVTPEVRFGEHLNMPYKALKVCPWCAAEIATAEVD